MKPPLKTLLRALIFTALSIAWTEGAFAASDAPLPATKNRCENYLSLPLSPRKHQALVTADHAEIETVFSSSESFEKQMDQAFGIYLNARLSQLSDKRRAVVEPYAKELEIRFVSKGQPISATANAIEMPESLRLSAIPWIVLAHEMEHRIQLKIAEDRTLKQAGFLLTTVLGGPWLYHSESRAMQAELEFMNSLPEDLIFRSRELIRIGSLVSDGEDKKYFEFFSHIIEGYGLSSQEYLQYQHGLGRYSAKSIAKKLARWENCLPPLGVVGSVGLIYMLRYLQ